MGIFVRGNKLWLRFKGPDGKWRNEGTQFVVGEEAQAQKVFTGMTDRFAAGASLIGNRREAVTLAEYAQLKWFKDRRGYIASAARDEGRLQIHVFPRSGELELGKMKLEAIRPRHLAERFRGIRAARALAPKSIHNVYGVLRALFRDAEIDGLIDRSPCILTEHQLGKNMDSDPEWRATAIYKRAELEQLVSDPRIPLDRRTMYGLQGIGGLRHGEAAGLRWRHVDTTTEPLGQLVIATSYDQGRTKTKVVRYTPIHPALASLLAQWRLSGWAAMLGRQPGPDDLVVPTSKPVNKGPRVKLGSMRTASYSWKRLAADLELLGMRHRRGHDLRRTFISLARSDGAAADLLRRATHQPPKETIEGYSSFEWSVLCREVLKLQLSTAPREPIAAVIGLTGGLVTWPLPPKSGGENHRENYVEAVGIEPTSESL